MGCGATRVKINQKLASENLDSMNQSRCFNESFIVENPKKFTDVYKIGEPLGSGAYGEVRMVTHRLTNQDRAVKIYRKSLNCSSSYAKIKLEIEILKQLSHPIIVKIFEYFEDEKKVYIVLEKCDGGELFDEIFRRKFLSENIAALIAKQLFSVVAYLHDKQIAHRDIKPENILLEGEADFVNIKIIDFGAAVSYLPKSKMSELIGSTFYISPEVVNCNYTEKCDEWSCGVIIFILLCGAPPFPGRNDDDIVSKIKKGVFTFDKPIWQQISSEAKDLINQLLCPEKYRLTAKQALQHPWIQKLGTYPSPRTTLFISALENLKSFQSANKLKEAISMFITLQVINIHDVKELKELFKAIDKNGDGRLSREEIKEGILKLQGIDASDEHLKNIINEVDTDGDGFINYEEFIKATLSENVIYSKENLKKAFDMFDLDGSGKICLNEMASVFKENVVDKNTMMEFMKEADRNSDGEIDFDEFSGFFTRLSIRRKSLT